jgi:hypothetical protein
MREITSPISGFSSPIGQKRFSVRDLFRFNEPGVWYDPSDLTTMFQDRAGTTPVTAPGQTVGLVLDKSRGLVPAVERIANGAFDSAASWTLDAGWAISGGQATFTAASANRAISQTGLSPSVAGRTYLVTYTVVSNTLNGGNLRVGGFSGSSFWGSSPTNLSTTVGNQSARILVTAPSGPGTVFDLWVTSTATSGSITIDNISVRELPGNHLVANSDAARGLYQVDETGRPYILFDGAGDGYVTPTITPGTDKVQLWAGIRKNSDAARGTVAELSTTIASNNGALQLTAPNAASATYAFESKGTTLTDAVATPFAAPLTSVVTGLGDIAGDSAIIRVNGVEADADTGDQGTGNYLAAPLYVGRRGAASQPFNGRLYQLAVRFGPNLDTSRIEQVERYMAQKTGVTL